MRWDEALADFEQRLDTAEASLALADADVPMGALPDFAPPAVDGPIPAELLPRAEVLLTRSEDLSRRYRDEVERIRAELRRLPRGGNRSGELVAKRFDIGA